MIPRGSRLKRKEIYPLQRKGSKLETSFFIVYKLPSDVSHTAVIVSNKVSKKSSERNRIRRAAQTTLIDYLNKGHGDMLVVAKETASGVSGSKLQTDLAKTLSQS